MTGWIVAYGCTFCSALFKVAPTDPDHTDERCPSCDTGHLIPKSRLTEDDLRHAETAT